MRKFVIVLMVVVLVLCSVGCEDVNKNITPQSDDKDINVWTDVETGVQYVIFSRARGYSGMGGITPRLNADGTLYYHVKTEDTEHCPECGRETLEYREDRSK